MDLNNEAETIQRHMQAVRCELDNEVVELMRSARAKTDWRYYVRRYAATCVWSAVALGVWIAPKRGPQRLAGGSTTATNGNRMVAKPEVESGSLRMGGLLAMVGSALARAAFSYAGQRMWSALSPRPEPLGIGLRGAPRKRHRSIRRGRDHDERNA